MHIHICSSGWLAVNQASGSLEGAAPARLSAAEQSQRTVAWLTLLQAPTPRPGPVRFPRCWLPPQLCEEWGLKTRPRVPLHLLEVGARVGEKPQLRFPGRGQGKGVYS